MIDRLLIHKTIIEIAEHNGFDYIDAVLHYCTINDLEIETVGAIISKDQNLVSQIRVEAENLNFIKKINQLPVL